MEKLDLNDTLSSSSSVDFKQTEDNKLNKNLNMNFNLDKLNIESENNLETENTDSLEKENSPEESIKSSSESVDIEVKDANTTNCLALTIQEEHKLVAVKNVFIRSIRMSWKVIVSAVTLAIIKLFT